MQYPVIVEHKNGMYRALIPALSGLSAEGASRDEAVKKAQQAAEAYLSKVEVTMIELDLPGTQPLNQQLRPGSPQAVLKALEAFAGDEEAIQEHFEEIERERQREREELARLDAA